MLSRFKLTRRRWNSVLMAAIILFMGVMAAPTLIKQYLILPHDATPPGMILNPSYSVIEINAAGLQLYINDKSSVLGDEQWRSIPERFDRQASQLVANWQAIHGTIVDESTLQQLKPALESPVTIEVWYQEVEEPQRITAYRFDQFWLMKTYNQEWVAVSFDEQELLPLYMTK
ncbi:hypothetical protein BCU70_16965 [Vibrio sp. 10N.286.49.C2]|uniref:hypothetical protein n=1 Tax=unclassified Vibrio TaxID=2614977 RepID=UPI000C817C1F|nr:MULTISPECIES: hypothetical protein [unclassified Vibrio]PMH36841.1 hypothetical protein BCU70_16965 [Vibrio sp. 10N.286.49.C2]PMH47926.1 hypothetical protein BCU66_21945 [Vibrio sp. 10N.286.49.B1]PMH83316.1 hypothetical protein BCU58_15360 [Vibrio sp. 10N.286.48.B7]